MEDAAPQDRARLKVARPGKSAWQDRLLPLMSLMLIGLTLFFVTVSYLQLSHLSERILAGPQLDLTPALTSQMDDADFVAHWRALVILEGNALERRHHQANVLLMSRVWLRYLGFLTGMTLSLIGSAFILGKLRERPTSGSAEGMGWSISTTSTSPGIILALLGVSLMIVAIVSTPAVSVTDGRAYLGNENSPLPGVAQ
jgi:hypothetical protein